MSDYTPNGYFPGGYFPGAYFGGSEQLEGAISAALTGGGALTGDLTAGGAATDIEATLSGSGALAGALTAASQAAGGGRRRYRPPYERAPLREAEPAWISAALFGAAAEVRATATATAACEASISASSVLTGAATGVGLIESRASATARLSASGQTVRIKPKITDEDIALVLALAA